MNKTERTINAWWSKGPQPGNFGDILTPILLDSLFGYKCVYTHRPFPSGTLIGVGSIINHAGSNTIVWGSGMMRDNDTLKRDALYLSVRGPLTYEKLKEKRIPCNPVFGDPALLMPKVFNKPDVQKKYEYGFFAHYVDTDQVSKWYTGLPNIKVINPLDHNPLRVIAQVLECEKIISSSLHGVIIAHAYGIPAVWVKHSDKLNGDGLKFKDYFQSVKLIPECIDFQQRIPPEDLGKFNYQVDIDIDVNKIMKPLQAYLNE